LPELGGFGRLSVQSPVPFTASVHLSRFVGPSSLRSLPFSARAAAILIAVVPSNGKCCQMRCSLDQLQFRCCRRSWNATVHLEGSQHAVVPKRNVCRPIQTQPKLQSAASNRFKITLRVVGQQHHRHDVPDLEIEGRAHVIQDLRERCPHGDQIQNVFLSQQIRPLFASTSACQRRPSVCLIGILSSSCLPRSLYVPHSLPLACCADQFTARRPPLSEGCIASPADTNLICFPFLAYKAASAAYSSGPTDSASLG
jgi:hypothetical protein